MAPPLAIDEAQRVPALLEAIKLVVDRKRIPGKFILLGSTEFSHLTKNRESLTGRMGRLILYTFNLAESLKLPAKACSHSLIDQKPLVERPDLVRYLTRGGFPGIFSVRQDDQRKFLMSEWVQLACQRDIHQFSKSKFRSELARDILTQIAVLAEPNCSNISRALKKRPKTVFRHLEALKKLFVIHELSPHPLGTGKALYFHFDTGVATFLGANFYRQL